MKKLTALLACVALFAMTGVAWAIPTTWTDTIDFNPDILIPPSYQYTHNIADDGFSSLFMGGNDTISSYELKISIYDDNVGSSFWFPFVGTVNIPDGSEAASIWTTGGSYNYDFSLASNTFDGNLIGNIDLWADGHIDVLVSQTPFTIGDFYLASSELTAYGDDGTAPVPEPGTIVLLGAGLAGLGLYGRRRMRFQG